MRSVAVVARSKPDPEDVAIERLGEWHGRVALHPRLLAGGLEYPAELAPAHSDAPQPVARHFRLLRRRSGKDAVVRGVAQEQRPRADRSEEHTSELQSLMRISYAVFCLKKKKNIQQKTRDRK